AASGSARACPQPLPAPRAGPAGFVTNPLPSRLSSANLEARDPFRMLLGHLDRCHLRAAPPSPAERHHLFDRLLIPPEDRLDGSLPRVPHPAGDADRLGPAPGRVPEEDSLDAPADDDPPPGQGLLLFVVLGGDADARSSEH